MDYDYIVHVGTGTIIASRECMRISSSDLDLIDEDNLLELEHALERHGVPMDAAIHVVSAGSPHDGLTLFGPFYTAEEAGDWAERHIDDIWEVVTPQTGIW